MKWQNKDMPGLELSIEQKVKDELKKFEKDGLESHLREIFKTLRKSSRPFDTASVLDWVDSLLGYFMKTSWFLSEGKSDENEWPKTKKILKRVEQKPQIKPREDYIQKIFGMAEPEFKEYLDAVKTATERGDYKESLGLLSKRRFNNIKGDTPVDLVSRLFNSFHTLIAKQYELNEKEKERKLKTEQDYFQKNFDVDLEKFEECIKEIESEIDAQPYDETLGDLERCIENTGKSLGELNNKSLVGLLMRAIEGYHSLALRMEQEIEGNYSLQDEYNFLKEKYEEMAQTLEQFGKFY